MRKVLSIVLYACALALAVSMPARSQVALDVSKLTCMQYIAYKVTNPKYLAVWISGFHHGKSGSTVIDMQTLVENAGKLEEYCGQHPDALMMQAAETVLEPQN
jgi:acid stress chaperone HdeB